MNGPLLFGILVAVLVLVGFVAIWRIARSRDSTDQRLQDYASSQAEWGEDLRGRREKETQGLSRGRRLLAGLGLGPRIAAALAAADLPLTATEFTLIVFGAGLAGFLIGLFRATFTFGLLVGPIAGLALGGVFAFLPIVYLRVRRARRQRALTEQLPDVLTLLVGSLRSGHGLSQALDMLVQESQPPAKTEFGRVMRAVSLGTPVQIALRDMADRVGSDDLDLIVTAITAQFEMGGNLAETLETISQTVRDRINLLREIRVLTSQQRFTGYTLAVLPVIAGVAIFLINPSYMSTLFEPGLVRVLPAGAVVLQVLGFIIMQRIVDIEV
jgi:tight adherence protein B